MTPLDLFRILALVFYIGEADGRVGLNAPPAQATELWIAHHTTHRATAWLTVNRIVYTTTPQETDR